MKKFQPKPMSPENVVRVVSLAAELGGKGFEHNVMWRVDGDHLTCLLNVSDVFAWGLADAETVTDEEVSLLEKVILDIEDVGVSSADWTSILFAARKRGMRPQGFVYRTAPRELWSLLDECGPLREVNFTNPKTRDDK